MTTHPVLLSVLNNLEAKQPFLLPYSAISNKIMTYGTEQFNHCANDTLAQGFHWCSAENFHHNAVSWWQVLQEKAEELSTFKVNRAWLPPIADSVAMPGEIPKGYLPRDRQRLNPAYGTTNQLTQAVTTLKQCNIKPLADMVINHQCGFQNRKDLPWGHHAYHYGEGENHKFATGPQKKPKYKYFGGAPNIYHDHPEVKSDVLKWIDWHQDTHGFNGGVRWDFVLGYPGSHNQWLLEKKPQEYSVGELFDYLDVNNPDAHRMQLVHWISEAGFLSTAFDFTTKGMLQHAIHNRDFSFLKDSQSNPVGLIGVLPTHATTFIDNHDTGPSFGPGKHQNCWPFPSQHILMGYAYILTHPGIPMLYWVHCIDWDERHMIKELAQLRKSAGLNAKSTVQIIEASQERYAALIDEKVMLELTFGHKKYHPEGFEQIMDFEGFAVWAA